jgi:hypothetical protein
MTLNLMLINRSGIWQSSDHRTTNWRTGQIVSDYTVKHVVSVCRDGIIALTYSGIGTTRDGTSIINWVRRIWADDQRSVDESQLLLAQRAGRDLGPILVQNGIHHTFTIGAFIQGHPFAIQIRNFGLVESADPKKAIALARNEDGVVERLALGPPQAEFIKPALHVGPEGLYMASGSGARFVPRNDQETLLRVRGTKPGDPRDFCALLAEVNRRAAVPRSGVSKHCVTVYAPQDRSAFLVSRHDATGANKPVNVPILMFGIDFTDQNQHLAEMREMLRSSARPGGNPTAPKALARRLRRSTGPVPFPSVKFEIGGPAGDAPEEPGVAPKRRR